MLTLFLVAALAAQGPEHWQAYSRTAVAVTGGAIFTPSRIEFSGGHALPLAFERDLPGYQAAGAKADAKLYRVPAPADPILRHGNRLCGGRTPEPVTYIIVARIPAAAADRPAADRRRRPARQDAVVRRV